MTKKKLARWLHEYSIPLVLGVVAALFLANSSPEFYHRLTHTPVYKLFSSDAGDHHSDAVAHGHANHQSTDNHHAGHHEADAHQATDAHHETIAASVHSVDHSDTHASHGHDEGIGHYFTLHFLINDLFMVLFFGVAAKEITEACLPKGALNPVSKAINPLFATLGGVLGPVAFFLTANALFGDPAWTKGWGIPTATDIALAWMVARLIFGANHPAISFLLLLAVADDAIGLGIIAIAYPDPTHPTEWINALWIVPGMITAFILRKCQVQNWLLYIVAGGVFSWWGLYSAHLHPALALVFIVPFIPGPNVDFGLYRDDESQDAHADCPLEKFEHQTRLFVDCGLFFFALVNAGVSFNDVTGLTWILLASLAFGKTLGVAGFSMLAVRCGFPLPAGMNIRHTIVVGIIAGLGLTVALFVSGQAFVDPSTQSAAKMGALFSVVVALVAVVAAKALGVSVGSNKSTSPAAAPIGGSQQISAS